MLTAPRNSFPESFPLALSIADWINSAGTKVVGTATAVGAVVVVVVVEAVDDDDDDDDDA